MGAISQAFGGALSPALRIAEKVYDGFTTLLGVKGVTPEVEALHGNLLTKSGYLLVSNATEDTPFRGKMFVSGRRLRQGDGPSSPLVTGFDYCLLAVQRRKTIIDASSTAPDLFGALWTRVVNAFEGSADAAHDAFKRLQRVIYGSPDLIARDRDALLAGYLVEYQKAVQLLGEPAGPQPKGRGTGGESITKAVSGIPKLYAALVEERKEGRTEEERKRWASGSGAWMRAGQFRSDLKDKPAGFVADTIIRAL